MNKYAELQKIATLYAACRGILRVKLAATAGTTTTPTGTGTTTPATGTATGTTTPATGTAANNNTQQQNPQNQQAGMGGIGRSLGNTAMEAIFGQTYDPNNSAGGNLGEKAMNWAGKGWNAATKWMGNQKGWVGAAGRFLNKNQGKMGNIISGANQMLGGTNALQGMVRANNTQAAMTAQQQQQQQSADAIDPDAMFAQSMNMMANIGNGMSQPNQYMGSTFRPSFA